MGSVTTKHPRVEYGETVEECRKVDVAVLRKQQS